jgi:hypothetical protein
VAGLSSRSVGVLHLRRLGLGAPDERADMREGHLNDHLVGAGAKRTYFSPHDWNYDAVYGPFTKVRRECG